MSDSDEIRRALGGFPEKDGTEGDNAAIRNALNDFRYTTQAAAFRLPYPDSGSGSGSVKIPPKTVTPTQPTVLARPQTSSQSATQTSGGNWFSGIVDQFHNSMTSGTQMLHDQNVVDLPPALENIGGALMGGINTVGGIVGDVAGTVSGVVNTLDEGLIRAEHGGQLPTDFKPATDRFADYAGMYNENIARPFEGYVAQTLKQGLEPIGTGLSALQDTGWGIHEALQGKPERLQEDIRTLGQAAITSTQPYDAVQRVSKTINLSPISENLQRGNVAGAIAAVVAVGAAGYNALTPDEKLGADILLDPINFVPGFGIGDMQKAGKLAEMTGEVGRIANAAELMPKGLFGKIGTPAAKLTEVVKTGLQNIMTRTGYMTDPESYFSTWRAFEEAGKDAKGFEAITKTYAGLKSVNAQRAQKLLQDFGKNIDEVENSFRSAQTALAGAPVDAKTLTKAHLDFLEDMKAGRLDKQIPIQDQLFEKTQAEMQTRAQAHMAEMAKSIYPIGKPSAPNNVLRRMLNEVKGFEALVYIGLSPYTYMRNIVNGTTTMLIEGVNPLWDATKEIAKLKSLGQFEKAADLQRSVKMQEILTGTGNVVRKALGEGGHSTSMGGGGMGSFMSKVMDTKLGWGLRRFEAAEKNMRAKVYTDTYWKAINHNWDTGKWIPKMDAATEVVTRAHGIDPQVIYDILREAGPSEAKATTMLRDLIDGKRGPSINWQQVADEMGLPLEQMRAGMDEVDEQKAAAMFQEYITRVQGGEDKAAVAEDVIAKAAQELKDATAERIGAEVAPAMDMGQLETRLQELEDSQAALYVKGKVPKANREAFDALEAERDDVLAQLDSVREEGGWTDEERLFGKRRATDATTTSPVGAVDTLGTGGAGVGDVGVAPQAPVGKFSQAQLGALIDTLSEEELIAMSKKAGIDPVYYSHNGALDAPSTRYYLKGRLNNNMRAGVAPQVATESLSTPTEALGNTVGALGQGLTDGMYAGIWKDLNGTAKNPVSLQGKMGADIKAAFQRGEIKSPEDIRAFFNRPKTPPIPEDVLPAPDLPIEQLSAGQEQAKQYLLGLKAADGAPRYTAEQLATWKPDTLERVAGELQDTRATFDNIMSAAKRKGVATATEKGAPNNKYLLNVLNKHKGEGEAFRSIDDVRARADEALRILDSYTPEVKAGRIVDAIPAGEILTPEDTARRSQAILDEIRRIATEDPDAARILSRDEMVKVKAQQQANLMEALRNLWSREDVKRIRLGTDAEARLFGYLRRDAFPAMNDARQAAHVAADWMDNAVMISRDGETTFDTALSTLAPFQFWRSRFAIQSLRRVADKPARLAWYLKLRDAQDQVQNDPRYPKRLQGKMFIPFWGIPKWAGGGMWFDPEEVATSIESVFGLNQFDDSLSDSDVASAIRALASRGAISMDEAANAIANSNGALWEQTKLRLQQLSAGSEGANSFADMFRPHMPLDITWKLLTGDAKDIGVLFPLSRLIRGATGVNVEQPIKAGLRQLTGVKEIPDWDAWEQYRIDRALADLVGTGEVNERDALIALIERKGPAYDLATQRSAQQSQFQTFSVFGGNVFPEGEKEYYKAKGLQAQYLDQAVASLGGNPAEYSNSEKWEIVKANGLTKKGTPLGDFYNDNPVYGVRQDVYAEPEKRLKGFLIDEIWNSYNSKGKLDRRLMADDLGDTFRTTFLNPETKDVSQITLDQLGEWVRRARAYVPTQDTLKVGDFPEVRSASLDQNTRYGNITAARDSLFNMDALSPKLDAYHNMSTEDKRGYKAVNADLNAYLSWYAKTMDANPDIARLISPAGQQKAFAVDTRNTTNFATAQVLANVNRMVNTIGDGRARRFNPGRSAGSVNTGAGTKPLSNKAKGAIRARKTNPRYQISRDVFEELLAYFRAHVTGMSFQQWLAVA